MHYLELKKNHKIVVMSKWKEMSLPWHQFDQTVETIQGGWNKQCI